MNTSNKNRIRIYLYPTVEDVPLDEILALSGCISRGECISISGNVTFQPGLCPPSWLPNRPALDPPDCGAPACDDVTESLVKISAGGFLLTEACREDDRPSRPEEVGWPWGHACWPLPPAAEAARVAAAECNAGFKIMVFPPACRDCCCACISSADSVVSSGSEVVFNFLILKERGRMNTQWEKSLLWGLSSSKQPLWVVCILVSSRDFLELVPVEFLVKIKVGIF